MFCLVGVPGVGACSDYMKKCPAAVAGVRSCRGGSCRGGSCRGLFAFLPIISGLHVVVFGVSSYYMEKFKPGGGWCSVFVEKTNKEKKTRKRVIFFIKKC